MKIQSVAIVGMGALGLLFGEYIQKQIGYENVYFVMDEQRKKRNEKQIFTSNQQPVSFVMKAAGEVEQPADLVIFSVKYTGMKQAVAMLKESGCVGEQTTIISLMNGIDSEQVLSEMFGQQKIVYCVAQGMDAMRFGSQLIYTKMGQLHIGVPHDQEEDRLNDLCTFFDQISFPYVREEDILYRLWAKFMLNVGVNQTCMVFGVPYGGVLQDGQPKDVFVGAMKEVVQIANVIGIPLSDHDVEEYIRIIGTLDPEGTPSMGQDRINRVHSEVDMFAGKVIALGEQYHIDVPVNRFLYERVKEIEAEY